MVLHTLSGKLAKQPSTKNTVDIKVKSVLRLISALIFFDRRIFDAFGDEKFEENKTIFEN
jgi:hypothetical protein